MVNSEKNEEVVLEHSDDVVVVAHAQENIEHGEETHELIHENSLFAEPIADIGGFPITNSLVNSWAAILIIVIFSVLIKRKINIIPGKMQNAFEMVIEVFLGMFDAITGSRKLSLKFFPLVFSFFVLILVSNWLGLLPGMGSIGQIQLHDGHNVFIPYLRAGTADLNTTLALATIAVVASHIIGVISIGIWSHLNKFFNVKAIAEIPKKFKEDKMVIMVNPVMVMASLLEIITELAKVASLSFRLFGNVFAGEVLLATMSAMLAFGLPLPFMFLEVLVGFVQALVFALLTLSYLTMSTEKH